MEGQKVFVDSKLLDFYLSHANQQNTCCPLYLRKLIEKTTVDHLECGHFILSFLDQVLPNLEKTSHVKPLAQDRSLRQRTLDGFKNMARSVSGFSIDNSWEVKVMWNHSESKSS
jgi:hypothetical protein